jgi:hypothetical protein
MATREEIKLQNEYNEALKLSQSVSSAITKDLEEQIDRRTKLGKQVKAYLSNLQSEISQLETSEDIQKQILKNEKEIDRISNSYFGAQQKVGKEKIKALTLSNTALKIEAQRLDLIEKVDDEAKKLSDSLTSGIDDFVSSIKEIPVLGGIFGAFGDMAGGVIKEKISKEATLFTTNFAANIRSGQTAMQALGSAGSTAGRSLLAAFAGPQAIIAAIVIGLAASVLAFYQISAAAKEFREETGLLNSQTVGLDKQINDVYKSTVGLGASMSDISKAASTFVNEFEGLDRPSNDVLKSMTVLNKNFGVSLENGAKLNKIFQNMTGLSAEQSQYMVGMVTRMADTANVAPDRVIKDMAESSEELYKYFNGSPTALAKAAVEAAKLGTSLRQASDVANNLLDFESSINSELEAGAMLGINLNLSRARYLAANKDTLGAQQEVLNQVSRLGDLTKLSTFEMEALAAATGMPIDDLIRQQQIRERFGPLEKAQLEAANALLDTGKDITQITEKDLKAQSEQLALQKETQSEFDVMANQMKAAGTQILSAIMPIGKLLVSIIMPLLSVVTGFFGIISKSLGRLSEAFDKIAEPFRELFGGSSSKAFSATLELIGEILGRKIAFAINMIADALSAIGKVFGGLINIIKGIVSIFTGDFLGGISMIGDGLMDVFGGIIGFFVSPITAAVTTLMDFFSSIASKIRSVFEGMLPDWAVKLLGGQITTPATGTPVSDGGSIDDGIVQNGKIITTNPADTLIATKTPNDLLGNIAAGVSSLFGGGSDNSAMVSKLDELISEIKVLRSDLNNGKIAVYVDGRKVTSSVSRVVDRVSTNSYGL